MKAINFFRLYKLLNTYELCKKIRTPFHIAAFTHTDIYINIYIYSIAILSVCCSKYFGRERRNWCNWPELAWLYEKATAFPYLLPETLSR